MLSDILPEKFLKWLRKFIAPRPEDINHYLSADSTLIDIGAGNGSLLATITATKKLAAVEVWDTKIEFLKKTLPHVEIFRSIYDVQKSFDVVTAVDVLHHVEDDAEQELFIEKLHSLVAAGGTLIIKDMRDDLLVHKYFNRLSDFVSTRSHSNEANPEALIGKLMANDFSILLFKKYNVGLYGHYYIAAQKPASKPPSPAI